MRFIFLLWLLQPGPADHTHGIAMRTQTIEQCHALMDLASEAMAKTPGVYWACVPFHRERPAADGSRI